MRTIGYKWKFRRKGDYTTICDICAVSWPRSQLRRDRSGWLRCPDDRDGKDPITLDENNAHNSRRRGQRQNTSDGGGYDGGIR